MLIDKLHPKRWFRSRKSLNWRIPLVCNIIIDTFNPTSVIDFGCGNGDLLSGFAQNNIKILGIEGTENAYFQSMIPRENLYIFDISEPLVFKEKYDLCLCLEVAEHIPADKAMVLITNLTRASDRILFSAAPPGQGGIGHINCQSQKYWIDRFENPLIGYTYRGAVVGKIQHDFILTGKHDKKGIKAYYNNLMYFERKPCK